VSGDAWVSGDARVYGGWCFAFKASAWTVTEVEVEGGVLLVKDYVAPPVEKPQPPAEIVIEGATYVLKG
jgi:hypothetical protein